MRHGTGQMVLIALALGLTAAAAGRAQADIVTYNFTGSVRSVTDGTAFDLNGTIPFATAVTGSFSYDTAAAAGSSTSNQATYPTAPVAFSVNVGGGLLTYNPTNFNFFGPSVIVSNNLGGDDAFVFRVGDSPPTGLTLPAGATTSTPFAFVATVELLDESGTALSSTAIPTSLNLADFTASRTFLRLDGGMPLSNGSFNNIGEIAISLSSLTLQAVPEPSSLVLVGTGVLIGLGAAWRRRTRG